MKIPKLRDLYDVLTMPAQNPAMCYDLRLWYICACIVAKCLVSGQAGADQIAQMASVKRSVDALQNMTPEQQARVKSEIEARIEQAKASAMAAAERNAKANGGLN